MNKLYYFVFQKIKYIFDDDKNIFINVSTRYDINGRQIKDLVSSKGLSNEPENEITLNNQKALFGSNEMVMTIPPFMELFKERATAPFFVFQVFCVVLWSLDEYWYYSLFTLFMLVTFEYTIVHQQIRSMTEIRNMGSKSYKIYCLRENKWVLVDTNDLCPGDIVSLKSGRKIENIIKAPKLHPAMIKMHQQSAQRQGRTWQPPQDKITHEEAQVPCDLVLLSGRVIVDEAMLTGESVPQVKNSLDVLTNFDMKQHSARHIVFGGTKIVQHEKASQAIPNLPVGSGVIQRTPDNGCPALVVRTSFRSSQGKLLRTILYGAKRVTANNKETFAFILFLLCFAIAAVWYLWTHAPETRSKYQLLLESILIITSVIPPELPIELSLAVNNSLLSLTKLFIFCTEPFRIPYAGKVDICCFDKTGTLTTDTLVMDGVTDVETGKIISTENMSTDAQQILASCNALVLSNEGLPVGDPLEKLCLASTNWSLSRGDTFVPPKNSKNLRALKVIKRHHFSSFLKRMSAIAQYDIPGETKPRYLVTCKGAAEVLGKMLKNKPATYDKQHRKLAREGSRVLALAWKDLESENPKNLPRESVEADLNFAGFVCVNTPLKKDSVSALKNLRESNHHLVMITGDHVLTAAYVAIKTFILNKSKQVLVIDYDSNQKFDVTVLDYKEDTEEQLKLDSLGVIKLLPQYQSIAITGPALEYFEKKTDQINKIVKFTSVFARTSPQQKEMIINVLKQEGFTTLMCGDGTNDVGALKHAHVGIALLTGTDKKSTKKEVKKVVHAPIPEGASAMERAQIQRQQKLDEMMQLFQ